MPTLPPYGKDEKLPSRFLGWIEQVRELLRPVPQFREGNGSPEGSVEAQRGTRYYQLDGTTGSRLWVKTTTTGNTGWETYG